MNYILDAGNRCDSQTSKLKCFDVCYSFNESEKVFIGEDRCIDKISFSELKDHVECSYRHKLKYVDKINMFEENVHTNFGTALHDTCEHYLKTREMKYELALDGITKAWIKYKLPDMGQWLKEANALLEAVPSFLDDRFPGWTCFSAEEEMFENIPGKHSLDVAFKGFIDGVIEHNGTYFIIDWKSSTNGWNKWKKDDDKLKMQLILYAKFWGQKHSIPLSKINVGFVILNRDLENPERIEFFSFPVEESTIKKTLKVLNNSLDLRTRGAYFKRWKYQNPQYQRECRFCDYNGTKHCP